MTEAVRTIRLYGTLGTQFGRVHRLVVNSPAQAVRALCILVPGFERALMQSRERGLTYAVFTGRQNVRAEQMKYPGGSADIRIAPLLQGSKQAGLFQTILGAAMAAVGYYFGWTGVGAMVGNIGVAMMAGGIQQLLSPHRLGLSVKDSAQNEASYVFNGPVNTEAQGGCVPVLYGEMEIGSAVASAGIYAQDQL
ncbi:tail assembly protein [Paraburkholderia bonniea]|uniref:tail assembly protein n=1 Tax=Paraburkholderia bonniea TaxID=2152891 RepID=UPI001291740A|nr:tail assembly protein [Paraburkholderia bonniea]WJF92009.1 tail assembly protein [Paraburkholderia bonniea]WJF95328.1 tail assembly protein [Paraburkholderia bonniea]